MHTAVPLVPEHSSFAVEIAIAKLQGYESLGADQISAELNQAGCKALCFETHLLIIFGLNKNCHPSTKNLSLYLLMNRVKKLTVVIIEECHF
jgi:hypothetical protein